jgi:acyl-CoA synthetase (AMP-forming)/AMP-acid ligase II
MLVPPLVGVFESVADAFEAAAAQHGDRVAYVDGGTRERWTFAEWYARSDALAAVLVERGVDPGDVVAIMLPSSFEYAVAYGAAVLAGAVATGINTRLGPREITAVVERADPAVVLFDPDAFDPAVASIIDAAPGHVLSPDAIDRSLGAAGLGPGRPRRSPSDAAVIIWTSGTTGVPKGAWFDHRGLRAAVASAGAMSAPFDVKLVATPFPHAGYMAKLWDQLAWVTTSVIAPTPWRADETLQLLADERVTVAAGVPTQWAKLLEQPGIADADLWHVRVGLAATAPAPPELVERVGRAIGCPLVVRYAMTESPSITGTEPDDPPEVQFRTVGRPQAGMEVEIADDRGEGGVGRVRVRGACLMRGYWGDPELTVETIDPDGWLTSSDLGVLRPDGNLVLVGRASDMYIRGGYNVYPLEVENVLAEHPAVDRAAIVGVPAPVIGEIGVAFVTVAPGVAPPSPDELRAWVADRLADYKAPDRVEVLEALPLTAMMKIDKTALLARPSARPTGSADGPRTRAATGGGRDPAVLGGREAGQAARQALQHVQRGAPLPTPVLSHLLERGRRVARGQWPRHPLHVFGGLPERSRAVQRVGRLRAGDRRARGGSAADDEHRRHTARCARRRHAGRGDLPRPHRRLGRPRLPPRRVRGVAC